MSSSFYSNFILFLFAICFSFLTNCTDDDSNSSMEEEPDLFSVSVTGKATVPNTPEEINLNSSYALVGNISNIILGAHNSPFDNLSIYHSGVGLSENDNPSEENGLTRIRLYLCGDTTNNYSDFNLAEMIPVLNSRNDDGFIFLEMFYNQEIYRNLDLEPTYDVISTIFEVGCESIFEADAAAETSITFGEPRFESGLRFAPARYTYTGYLYNWNKQDSIFIDRAEVNFPITDF